MKLLVEASNKEKKYIEYIDGIILSLKDYAVQSNVYYSLEEISRIKKRGSNPRLSL